MRTAVLTYLLLLAGCEAKFSRKTKAQKAAEAALEELCRHRQDSEFFRLEADGNCRTVHSCDRTEGIRIRNLTCPMGLLFDVEKQTCDWMANVENCGRMSLPLKVKANLATDEPVCPPGMLQCAGGDCIAQQLFCNNSPDCEDGSDENVCAVGEDPNGAPPCNLKECSLPECFCSPDGTRIPGSLEVPSVPMMISLSFNGAVNEELTKKIYDRLFHENMVNPNGCTAKGTFFVSHKYTDYSAVQHLHIRGHEIGTFSITHKEESRYWTEGTYDTWLSEMAGSRLILEKFANITDGSIIGTQAPYQRVGGNDQFSMLSDQYFAYDASLTVPLGRVPVWPYTLQYRMPHKCMGNAVCPTRSYNVWELPINELDRSENVRSEKMTGCHQVSSCTHIYEPEQLRNMLDINFKRHYETNRAPLALTFSPAWLLARDKKRTNRSENPFVDTLAEWMADLLKKHTDVFFVTKLQIIQWMQNPTDIGNIRKDFEEWQEKCKFNPRQTGTCLYPNHCELTTKELPGEVHIMRTCTTCPRFYPWIADPTGDGGGIRVESAEEVKNTIALPAATLEPAEAAVGTEASLPAAPGQARPTVGQVGSLEEKKLIRPSSTAAQDGGLDTITLG